MTVNTPTSVTEFYDGFVAKKLEDFVEGNGRVERAWETVESWMVGEPKRILEIGCGIGDISWRMAQRWPDTEVVGIDISPHMIDIARVTFVAPNLKFLVGSASELTLSGNFDGILLMDVYEHICQDDRHALHKALCELLSPLGRVVLSFPTPRAQKYLRDYVPTALQPVEEDVSLEVILTFAREIRREVLMYREVQVSSKGGDYAHAVIGAWPLWPKPGSETQRKAGSSRESVGRRIAKRLLLLTGILRKPILPNRNKRFAMVKDVSILIRRNGNDANDS